jgi:hypothetical protein
MLYLHIKVLLFVVALVNFELNLKKASKYAGLKHEKCITNYHPQSVNE